MKDKYFQAKKIGEFVAKNVKKISSERRKMMESEAWVYIKKGRVLEREWVEVKYKILFLLLKIDLRDNSLLKIIIAKYTEYL